VASNNNTGDRHIVPRWRRFRDALSRGELAGTGTGKLKAVDGEPFVREKELSWAEKKDVVSASDLISAAVVFGVTPTSEQAAKFILEAGKASPSIARRLAQRILGIQQKDSSADVHGRIDTIRSLKSLKQRRITRPRNAFVWVDLARLYVMLGQNNSARRALRVAQALAPTERFVLRSSARFLHHVKDHEEALDLLRKNPATSSDSWLMAAEIAASGVIKKTPKFVKTATRLLNSNEVSPFHVSELASALAGLQMSEGNDKFATRMFKVSLKDPTENSLAQAAWASKRLGWEDSGTGFLEQAHATEAITWDDFHHGRWENVVRRADEWAKEEMFSARPRLLASSTAATFLDRPDLGEEIARNGLLANPGHATLVNNLAFALILQGKPQEAFPLIQQAFKHQLKREDAICLLATAGLAYFRLGNEVDGKAYYQRALDYAQGPDDEVLKIAASLYLGRELSIRGDKVGLKLFKESYDKAQKLQRTHMPALAEQLLNDVEKSAAKFGTTTGIIRKVQQPFKREGVLF
jgi:tetratricopeptide (TPR) repeat protein